MKAASITNRALANCTLSNGGLHQTVRRQTCLDQSFEAICLG